MERSRIRRNLTTGLTARRLEQRDMRAVRTERTDMRTVRHGELALYHARAAEKPCSECGKTDWTCTKRLEGIRFITRYVTCRSCGAKDQIVTPR